MRFRLILFFLFLVFYSKAQEIPNQTWQNILIWGHSKSNLPSINPKEIHLGYIDSLENWHWNHLDSSTTIKINTDKYAIFGNRLINLSIPIHQYWDFYLDSTHTHFKVLSDSLLKIFPKKPYKIKYTSEYRTLQTQAALLKKGKSKLPLSLHNFGFALDLGIYRGKRYLRKGAIYSQLGQQAKSIGLFWGGDFIGFPDAGHIQYFENTSDFLIKFPLTAFEYLPYLNHFKETYQSGVEKGTEAKLQDTYQLIQTLEKINPELKKISGFAIPIPQNEKLLEWLQAKKETNPVFLYHSKEKWFLIRKGDLNYFWEIR